MPAGAINRRGTGFLQIDVADQPSGQFLRKLANAGQAVDLIPLGTKRQETRAAF